MDAAAAGTFQSARPSSLSLQAQICLHLQEGSVRNFRADLHPEDASLGVQRSCDFSSAATSAVTSFYCNHP